MFVLHQDCEAYSTLHSVGLNCELLQTTAWPIHHPVVSIVHTEHRESRVQHSLWKSVRLWNSVPL